MKVTVDSIEFAWFSMYMPCDKGYTNHGLFEYIDLMKRVKYVTKLHLNILYGVILTQSYHGILSRQELSVHLLIMNKCFLCIDVECFNIPYTYCSKSNGCKSTIYHFTEHRTS